MARNTWGAAAASVIAACTIHAAHAVPAATGPFAPKAIPFDYEVVDPDEPGLRKVGDVDGDGLPDIVARNGPDSGTGVTVWYRAPTWERHWIGGPENLRTDDIELADIDADGDLDLVLAIDEPGRVQWFVNPRPSRDPAGVWPERHLVGVTVAGEGVDSYVKDLALADLDSDGRLDIAARTHKRVFIFRQEAPDRWSTLHEIDVPEHEGMDSGDLDADGDTDLLLNGYWLEQPSPASLPWAQHAIDTLWFSQTGGDWTDNNTKVVVADIDLDGRLDPVVCHSERERFPIAWYSAGPRPDAWYRHEVALMYDYCHTLQVADMDNDGDPDIVAGQMPKAAGSDKLVVFANDGGGLTWSPQRVSDLGIYSGVLGDIDADGDQDIVGSRNWDTPPIELWRNQTVRGPDTPTRVPTLTLTLTPTLVPGPRPTAGPRATDGLLALYTFEEKSGSRVRDVSGVPPALDLAAQDPSALQWVADGLRLVAPSRLISDGAAHKISEAVRSTGELTIEAWIEPANTDQDGPARVVSLSRDAYTRNVTLGQGLWGDQPTDVYDVRLRTTDTDANGTGSLTSPAGTVQPRLQHVVFTRAADGRRTLYVDGAVVTSDIQSGALSNWDLDQPLVLGNEALEERPWFGTLALVAIFDRALTATEVARHHSAGPRPSGRAVAKLWMPSVRTGATGLSPMWGEPRQAGTWGRIGIRHAPSRPGSSMRERATLWPGGRAHEIDHC